MFESFMNLIYPRYCTLCHRHGSYLCDVCKKSFKCNLPECYVCRRLSPGYATHTQCESNHSLDHVFVAWEYNQFSSRILKLLKYKGVTDTSQLLNDLIIGRILACGYNRCLERSLMLPVPISSTRKAKRGFNQSEIIAKALVKKFNCDLSLDLIGAKNTNYHMAGQKKEERQQKIGNPFYMKNSLDLSNYTSITIVDDVITTGKTLENVAQVLRENYSVDLQLNAICLFRGRPYYL